MQKTSISLWFDNQALEAAEFYVSVFGDKSKILSKSIVPDTPSGDMQSVRFEIMGNEYTAFNGGPIFKFNEAISIIIYCDTQEEIDYYWQKLSFVPESEQCGWLKDKFGLSWQIAPNAMNSMMESGETEKIKRVVASFLKMKKFDIKILQKAYDGV
jgi:predicted 3-demethylubiquinone-9 3-methyltransferase (glyoxalase superfamily)